MASSDVRTKWDQLTTLGIYRDSNETTSVRFADMGARNTARATPFIAAFLDAGDPHRATSLHRELGS